MLAPLHAAGRLTDDQQQVQARSQVKPNFAPILHIKRKEGRHAPAAASPVGGRQRHLIKLHARILKPLVLVFQAGQRAVVGGGQREARAAGAAPGQGLQQGDSQSGALSGVGAWGSKDEKKVG
jgi:hypothetical protein